MKLVTAIIEPFNDEATLHVGPHLRRGAPNGDHRGQDGPAADYGDVIRMRTGRMGHDAR